MTPASEAFWHCANAHGFSFLNLESERLYADYVKTLGYTLTPMKNAVLALL